ncbi:Muniscin C-terminal mu homology domain-containing protein [Hypoxylon trugodes]|uniref:Muniscin C-terminal mu homology domain-containing protein n=1 Tax=Hypoxylon trugodes TaxID=326681 RepID=UPI00219D9919|nr:Muniscin C-terminal mu homology domain-containing protein [Hypoxylon trugodes]KAI1386595.1 Muniscin C-terminal mu homology domain-containing protein [Hypoxylon trugodes]
MEDLSRSEYPAMLANLQPNQAVHALNDRVKRITKVNNEIADWLQERRKVEEQYVAGLKRLTQFRVPNAQSELGTFQPQWDKIIQSADAVAMSHHIFATKIEKDVETPLRSFHQRKEMINIHTVQGNLQNMAKELEDAQERSEKLTKKGGKASAQKVDLAAGKLESATQQWESQAPFIFESLQALDESRMDQLRNSLTLYGTYEGEQAQSHQSESETVLNSLLDYTTAKEIEHFVAKTTAGRPKLEKRTTTTRQSSSLSGQNSATAPAPSIHTPAADDHSEHSVTKEAPPENKLRSRIGTMLGRRRQSIHGGFGQLSPAKGPFGRNIRSSHGLSPRASSSNLGDSTNRLGSLVEDPDTTETPSRASEAREKQSHDGTNGIGRDGSTEIAPPATAASAPSRINGTSAAAADVADVPPPPGPPPSHKEPEKDSEGFSVPAPSDDPISQAQREAAAQEAEQLFKLNIQKEPVAEEDPEEKKAALSNVANSLSAMGIPARKVGTVRGRRDVRNTIYVPAPVSEGSAAEHPVPVPPPFHTMSSKPAGVATLASEASIAGTSDTQSIRSGNSLSSIVHVKHPDMHEPGLNSSVMETVSATFENGEVRGVKVNGEIAFSYNSDSTPPTHLPIRINNFPALEAIGPNRIFVTNDAPDHSEQFSLDASHLQKTSIGFSYRLHIDSSATPTEHVPILLSPIWKPQGDKLGLLLQYKLNPAFKFANAGSSVQLHSLVLFASYEGKASGAQTKPSGTHLKEKHLIYWRLGDLTLSVDGDWQKIVCRIIGDQGVEPKPGSIEARWEVTPPTEMTEGGNAISVSRFEEGKGKEVELTEDDPFADDTAATEEGKWIDVPTIRKLVSGKYEAR